MTRVKICGISSEQDLRVAVDAGADAVGFLVDVPVDTPREVNPARAAELAAAVPPFVTSVLVTMPSAPERTVDLVDTVSPDVVQIHGDASAGDLAYLSANVETNVVMAVDADALGTAHRYDDIADALLVDSVDEDGAGGTGRTHDWSRTRELCDAVDVPVVLAGGLTPENVGDAVRTVDPFAVDVASGVERSRVDDATKDPDAVRRFVTEARRAEPTPTP